jgi:SAM-dependent methyltransferase
MNSASEFQDLLACPNCHSKLVFDAERAACQACSATFAKLESGPYDLRLTAPKRVEIGINIGPGVDGPEPQFGLMRPHSAPEVEFDPAQLPVHLSAEMATYIPRAATPDSVCLDLGCGAGAYRATLEKAGYRWVGFDYNHPHAPLWADAHALPFANNSIDFVMSLAVLEHIKHPSVMLREVARVLKPGGMYFGTVAYLIPFHDWASYFNMTHHGVWSALQDAGLETEFVFGDGAYLAIHALFREGLFVGLSPRWSTALIKPLLCLHRLYWMWRRRNGRARSDRDWQSILNTGAFAYRARKSDAVV